jgi:hypothetical protein
MNKAPKISLKLGSLKLADPSTQPVVESVQGFGTFSKSALKEPQGKEIVSENGKPKNKMVFFDCFPPLGLFFIEF